MMSTYPWEEELRKVATKYHIIACWLAGVLDPLWVLSDMSVVPDRWQEFFVIRLVVAALSLLGLAFRKHISIEMVAVIPVLGISLQNAYMYGVMDAEAFQKHTFAYVALFIGVGMVVFWKLIYSYVIVGLSIIANIVFLALFSPLTVEEIMVNGGLLTFTVAVFSILLIQTRYRLTKNEIISRLALAESNKLLEQQKEIIEEKNKDITDSINYAKNIQMAVLPNFSEIDEVFKDHFVFYKPKDIVSGDFYWFGNKGGKALIAACDCTGHGVPGAFVSMIGNNLLNQIVLEQDHNDTGRILSLLNDGVKRVFTRDGEQEAQDGMDMALLSFELGERHTTPKSVQYSGAGNPLYFIRKGIASVENAEKLGFKPFEEDLGEWKGDRTPIGGSTEQGYEFGSDSIELQEGDTMYIFSDGFPDQFGGEKGKKFLSKRLKKLLLSIQDETMQRQKEILEQTMADWMGELEQVDDLLVIGIRV
ncbi:MAG: SpoIIE family protein phosphatase [Flavobacteriales bacterium]|nr:SpoIIE family protein phosphatase [Flavobacteriales bacterium]